MSLLVWGTPFFLILSRMMPESVAKSKLMMENGEEENHHV